MWKIFLHSENLIVAFEAYIHVRGLIPWIVVLCYLYLIPIRINTPCFSLFWTCSSYDSGSLIPLFSGRIVFQKCTFELLVIKKKLTLVSEPLTLVVLEAEWLHIINLRRCDRHLIVRGGKRGHTHTWMEI